MADKNTPDKSKEPTTSEGLDSVSVFGRRAVAVVAGIGVVAYTGAVVLGLIPEARKIDGSHLTLIAAVAIVVTVLWDPKALGRLKVFELAGLKFELREVKERQATQEHDLQSLYMILPVLLSEREQNHLINLTKTDGSTRRLERVDRGIQEDLRRLSRLNLIRRRPGREIGRMTDGADLGDFVELTDLGQEWVGMIEKKREEDSARRLAGQLTQ